MSPPRRTRVTAPPSARSARASRPATSPVPSVTAIARSGTLVFSGSASTNRTCMNLYRNGKARMDRGRSHVTNDRVRELGCGDLRGALHLALEIVRHGLGAHGAL